MSKTAAIAQAIEQYALQHPEAADAVEGIRQWWLGEPWREVSLDAVSAALAALVAQGRMTQVMLPDGRVIYRGTSARLH